MEIERVINEVIIQSGDQNMSIFEIDESLY